MTISVPPNSLTSARPTRHDAPLTLALVNNMPDTALRATERQFRSLIARASEGRAVAIEVYHIPQTPRGAMGVEHCRQNYRPLAALLETRVDACIVTGCEPKAGSLRDEPFWPAFTELVDWARTNTCSTLFSCLAAHAAVLHLDGIERRRMPRKLSGLYACRSTGTHPLAPGRDTVVPHSRYNALPEAVLSAKGYEVLTQSPPVGVDAFVKRAPSLFVFLQGHPEYEVDTLAREFRRDVERYLTGTALAYPAIPENYFPHRLPAETAPLDTLSDDTRKRVLADLAARLDPAVLDGSAWQDDSTAFYRRWLTLVDQDATAGGRIPAAPTAYSARFDSLVRA